MEVAMLHGSLMVELERAQGLQFGGGRERPASAGGGLVSAVSHGLRVVRRTGLKLRESVCAVVLEDGTGTTVFELFKTMPVKGADPQYNESQRVEIASGQATTLVFSILSLGVVDTPIYQRAIPIAELLLKGTVEELAGELSTEDGHYHAGSLPTISFKVTYQPLDYGVAAHWPMEVPNTYFPLRTCCAVRIYQDAHQEADTIPRVLLGNGEPYRVCSCWGDTLAALQAAQEFIYIAGWSVLPSLRLLRNANVPTLGDLLVKKASEGVKVCVMVWDDFSSVDLPVLRQLAQQGLLGETASSGVMGTHDETVKTFFKRTEVHVKKVPRRGGKLDALYKAVYTHHQKSVVCDYPAGNNMRAVVAFVGGIDLTNGRFDTAEHPLYRTNGEGGVHAEDYYTSVPDLSQEDGPRQPWEDIHTRLVGPIALDVMMNFEERWDKCCKWSGRDKLYNHGAGLGTVFIEHVPAYAAVTKSDDPGRWACQLFRSIDTRSVKFVRSTGDDPGMFRRKRGRYIDESIHRAYVHHIRRAQRFIYIENQYFLGSSHAWGEDRMKEASHLIPLEIALKIAHKIDMGQPFAVYCVIPLFPEGDPGSEAVQAILYWQRNTMEMMYRIIAAAIKRNGLGTSPTDYLIFFCLGKREPPEQEAAMQYPDLVAASMSSGAPRNLSSDELIKYSRRFMIYVHSKLMVVDDEVAIVGSANINMRSMSGSRDTELAVAVHQPEHTSARGVPRGQVYGFRMSLWAEHLGETCEAYERPHTLGCVHLVTAKARSSWEAYCSDKVAELPHHLMTYPVQVDPEDGAVTHIHDHVTFPDFPSGWIEGKKSGTLPRILTT